MDFIEQTENEKHPAVQLIFLGFLAIGGVLLFFVIALVMMYLIYGMDVTMNVMEQKLNLNDSPAAFRILLIAQNLGLFLTPALLLGITESKRPARFYGIGKPQISLVFIVFWLLLFSLPFIGFINELNQKMHLPAFLKDVELWMRRLEDEGAKTTAALLKMKTVSLLLVNLLVIALAPALCEEFFFRGSMQRIFWRWFKNPHVAIWVTAAIFSAIHFQFYGFFTRMFLGAGLGYIYFFTGSIWYSVFAHFLNNAYAVLITFYLQQKGLPITDDTGPNIGWIGYLISAILTLALFKILKDQAKAKQITITNLPQNS